MRYTDKMTVSDLMLNKVLTAKPEDKVEDVYRRMLEGNFRHMPVTDAAHKLIGIVSDRDLKSVLVFLNEPDGGRTVIGSQALTIDKVMTREPLRADGADSVKTAVKIMIRHKIGCLPVCDLNGKLLGILTETDLLKLLEDLLTEAKVT
jgi:CBS domain-containing protein